MNWYRSEVEVSAGAWQFGTRISVAQLLSFRQPSGGEILNAKSGITVSISKPYMQLRSRFLTTPASRQVGFEMTSLKAVFLSMVFACLNF